ncbi:4'-phosphopantetheinyl transferase superfamily protein [Actinokineospora auranticolor]|uniref:4'-phosphopantetheinyl transferase n=1 Tax=Actinokineospora auranticolor TaxID=155976 RepID=A0A2S6GT22_9PSEU|nr:4'-phosphopantetheinyl transferase superfamily protein [Actinokineospora auranticolor]PPK68374.1 4'-phosphopantetheinyl transferase [Actinokineospora auranticolor]
MSDTVRVWLIDTAMPTTLLNRLDSLLDRAERGRADEMDTARRREFVIAHGVARVLTGRELGIAPDRVRWEIGEHGKPEVDGLRVSMSRSRGLALFAHTASRAVGVDLERVGDGLDFARAAARYYPEAEARHVAECPPGERPARFTGLLTRKEACVKAAGGRLFPGLRLPVHARAVVHQADGPYRVRDLPAPAGYAAAVALAGTDDYRVREHRWPLEGVAPW